MASRVYVMITILDQYYQISAKMAAFSKIKGMMNFSQEEHYFELKLL
jgi:hypothetical protein